MRSAGRELAIEEEALRREWMGIVYDLLDALDDDAVNGGWTLSSSASSDSGGGRGRGGGGGGEGGDDYDDHRAARRISRAIHVTLSIREELRNEEARSGGERDSSVVLSNLIVKRALASMSTGDDGSPMATTLPDNDGDDPVARAFLINNVRVALVMLTARGGGASASTVHLRNVIADMRPLRGVCCM